jgi:hypothetical protein
MRRDALTQILASLAIAICLGASGLLAAELAASAGRNKLVYTDRAEEGDPPEVALGVAMGAFRGLFVNWLWMRANELKEAGRFYEAIELSSAITRLQPRFPRVWAFHAWNMAYNISVLTNTAAERWQWVQAGIRLLRDQGIPANPNDLLVHRELAWIYLHKIQGYTDDANPYYKRQVAAEWTFILGPPPPPTPEAVRQRDRAIERFASWLESVADAPASLDALIRANPSVGTLVERLRTEVGEEPGLTLLTRHEQARALRGSIRARPLLERQGPRMRALTTMMDDASLASAWSDLLAFTRRKVLTETYHMEPARMVRYTRQFGPIDWRHPAAHALYWSRRGVEEALTRTWGEFRPERSDTPGNREDFDFLNADRVYIQSVQELWRSGELYFDFAGYLLDPAGGSSAFYLTVPNPHFIPTYGQILDDLVSRAGIFEDPNQRVYRPLGAGYENFMKDAIRFFYRRGQHDVANRMYDDLARWEGQNFNDFGRAWRFSLPLNEFLDIDMEDRYTVPDVARSEIAAALEGAYISGLLAGDIDMFRAQFEYARQFHAHYLERQGRSSAVDPEGPKMQFPRNFQLFAGGVFAAFLTVLDLDEAQRVYLAAPVDLQRFAYDPMADIYHEGLDQMAAAGQSPPFAQLFPEPEGMEAFRAWQQAQIARQQRDLRVAPK